jgi:hypothetical protein
VKRERESCINGVLLPRERERSLLLSMRSLTSMKFLHFSSKNKKFLLGVFFLQRFFFFFFLTYCRWKLVEMKRQKWREQSVFKSLNKFLRIF